MYERGMARRVVISALLVAALAVPGLGWAGASPDSGAVDHAVTLTRPLSFALDAAAPSKSDVLSGGWAEQRLSKARLNLGLAVLVGMSLLLAAATFALTRPLRASGPTLWRRGSAARRAPPIFRLT